MNTHDLRMAMIAIAQTLEAAGAAILGHRLRALPDPDSAEGKLLWLERMRDVATITIDCCRVSARSSGITDGPHAAWRRVAQALDTWGPFIAGELGEGELVAARAA